MSYRILNVPDDHVCLLPPAENFKVGTRIQCTDEVLREGRTTTCNRQWKVHNLYPNTPWWRARPREAAVPTWREFIPDYTW